MVTYIFYVILLAGRYVVTSGTGDLYIRSVKSDDNTKKFSCQTTNILSGERKLSEPVYLSIKGKLRHYPKEIENSLKF